MISPRACSLRNYYKKLYQINKLFIDLQLQEEVLQGYHETLHRVIRDQGITDFDYSFDELVDDYRVGQSIGLVFCMFALPMVLAEPDDTVEFFEVDFTDSAEMKKFGDQHNQNFEKIIAKDLEVKDRIQGVFDDMIKAKIL